MAPGGAPQFDAAVVAALDMPVAERELTTLLGCPPDPDGLRFQLPRGALALEHGPPGLCALILRATPPEPRLDFRGLDVRFAHPAPLPAAPPPGEFLGIDHVVVHTTDPDAAIALWRDQLGIRLALDRRFPDFGMRLVFLRSGGVTIEFACPLDGADPGAPDRLYGISFKVADVARTRTRLLAAGLEVSEVRPGRKAGTRVATVRSGALDIPTLLVEPAPTAPPAPSPPAETA